MMLDKRTLMLAVPVWVTVLAATAARADDVSGTVRSASGGAPIGGAIVTLQATAFRATTAVDGTYTLTLDTGTDLVIVAAAKGFLNQSILVDTPATEVDFALEAVLQTDDPTYEFLEPETCGLCHPNQLDEWKGTGMAMAGFNVWVNDIYSGQGTPGGMGGFVYLRDSVYKDSNPNSECASCHQPQRWIEEPFSALFEPDPDTPENVVHGIACDICHKIADVDVAKINYPGIFPGAVTFTRPEGPDYFQVQYGVLGDVDFSEPYMMRASYQPQLVAEMCGTCHQDKNDLAEDHSFTGVTSEPTYIEWLESPYSDPESPFFATCVDCHMPPSGHDTACAMLFPPIIRDPNTIRSHKIEGTTPYYLENAVEMFMETAVEDDALTVDVTIENTLTGHHVPTGVTVRNMILLVEAWKDGNDPLVDPLVYTGGQTIHDLGGIGDPAEGYYAGLPGRFFAKVNHDAEGNGPTFFTEATGITFDNRIPAMGTDSTSYTFAMPAGGGRVNVRARLIYRRSFRFLVDAKQWTVDGHMNPLEDVAPPHFGHLKEISEAILVISTGDFDGNSVVNLVDYAALADCMSGPGAWPDPTPPVTANECLQAFDFDGDDDLDMHDWVSFLNVFQGP